jgi:tetratricopeptide (TPR) repeat protein
LAIEQIRLPVHHLFSKLCWATILVLILLSPAISQANAGHVGCPKNLFWAAIPHPLEQLQAEIERLASFVEACDEREDFHAQRGALLLHHKRFREAAIALERALLINPELAGAQLDYALALAALGQRDEAIDLLEQVAKRPDIEPELRKWLKAEIALAAQPGPSQLVKAPGPRLLEGLSESARLAGLVQAGIGRETNITSATHSRELTLYLNNGPVLVPLNESQAPQAALAQRTLVALQSSTRAGNVEIKIAGVVQARRSLSESVPTQQFSRYELQAAYPLGPQQIQVGVAHHDLEQGALYGAKDRKYAVTYLFDEHESSCRPQLNFSFSALSYPLSPVMDGTHRVIRAEASCSLLGELKFGAGVGVDEPKFQDRPGGSRRGWDAYARHFAQVNVPWLSATVKTLTWVRAVRTIESGIFNELLAQSPTDTRRLDAGVGISLPFRKQWEIGTEFETNSQQSSNPLLNLKNRSIYFVLRWYFA